MQKKPPILPIAIGLGVLAVGGTAFLLSRGPAAPTPAAATGPGTPVALAAQPTPVPEMRYIANRDIPPRTVMTADMMRRTAVSGPMPPGAVTSLDDLRGMITSEPIRSGDTITTDSFVKSLGRAIPANFSVPSGFRAVAIYVNPAQTAAGLVDVGDRVDVIATQKLSFDKQPNQFIIGAKEFTTGRTIGTNLLVLAVEKSLNAPVVKPTPTPAPGAAPGAAPAAAPADGALPADAAAPPSGGTAPAETRADAPAKPEGNIRVILAAPLETASRLVSANEGRHAARRGAQPARWRCRSLARNPRISLAHHHRSPTHRRRRRQQWRRRWRRRSWRRQWRPGFSGARFAAGDGQPKRRFAVSNADADAGARQPIWRRRNDDAFGHWHRAIWPADARCYGRARNRKDPRHRAQTVKS